MMFISVHLFLVVSCWQWVNTVHFVMQNHRMCQANVYINVYIYIHTFNLVYNTILMYRCIHTE